LKFAVVEKDEEEYYVASVPDLPGCPTQTKTLDELIDRIKEPIESYLQAAAFKQKKLSNSLVFIL
jgi:predicted RNase H-like HicB family nuclease